LAKAKDSGDEIDGSHVESQCSSTQSTITTRKNMHTMLYVTIKNQLAKLLSKMECGLVLQRHTSKNWRRVMAAVLTCVSTTTLLVPFSTPVSAITGTWTSYVPSTGTLGSAWRSVTFGNGVFVAVASNGTNRVMTSTDGITWTARTAAEANLWQAVTFGNGMFVAVASNGTNRVMTSTDGITWNAQATPTGTDSGWKSVTFGNGMFVAVANAGANQRVMTSTDGMTWTPRSAAEGNTWNSVTFGNGVFVAVSEDGTNRVMTSTDGITWIPRGTGVVANGWNSVTFGNGVFVAVAFDGTNRVMTSEDGITWTQPSIVPPAVPTWYSVGYGGGVFVALAFNSTQVMISSDNGATWTTNTTVASAIWNSVAYSNGVFVAVNENGTNRVARLDLRPSTPVTTNLRCINATTLVDVAVSNVGGSPIINYEYHISTSFPASQPTVWTAFSPAQNTTPLEWDMQALGYPAGVLHYYYVRAVNSFGASIGSWRSNIQESCTNSFRTTTTTSTTTTTTTTTPTTTIASSTPSVVTRDTSVSQVQSALPVTGVDTKQGLAIVVLFWMFGVGVITKVRRYYHGPA